MCLLEAVSGDWSWVGGGGFAHQAGYRSVVLLLDQHRDSIRGGSFVRIR